MKLHGFVSFDRELVVVNWDCLLVNRSVQVVSCVLRWSPVQPVTHVQKRAERT